MNKLTSRQDLADRFCWKDGKLYPPKEHRCTLRVDPGGDLFPQCYKDWYLTEYSMNMNHPILLNWRDHDRRQEWDQAGEQGRSGW